MDEIGNKRRQPRCVECTHAKRRTGRDKNKLHLNAIRHRCLKNGVPFNLELEDLSVPEVCPILGTKIKSSFGGGGAPDGDSPSVDRINPDLGYVKGNVMVVSQRANWIKRDLKIEHVLALLSYLEKNQ